MSIWDVVISMVIGGLTVYGWMSVDLTIERRHVARLQALIDLLTRPTLTNPGIGFKADDTVVMKSDGDWDIVTGKPNGDTA